MFQNKQLFENVNQCKSCKRPLPKDYAQDLCTRCQEIQLFHDVKDYIRSNDVNEYEVADHFNIPLRQVKEWIREGRIEYKETFAQNSIEGIHCQRSALNALNYTMVIKVMTCLVLMPIKMTTR